MTIYKDATGEDVNKALQRSWQAFSEYRKQPLKNRTHLLRTVANELAVIDNELIDTANRETHLDKSRLQIEFRRTLFQLTSYADACERGSWLDIRIDTGDSKRQPPKPDLRKMLVPLGPVVVFGAANFPFAYSTAGGDVVCALAAGCSVIVKAHPAHASTSELTANAIKKAISKCALPEGVFEHLHGVSFEVGKALMQHPLTKAVGFTGSLSGGKALFDIANQRPVPIPVFAEMSSVNPVFILPKKLEQDMDALVTMYAASITQSGGQFCTNPGILVGIESDLLELFKERLGQKMKEVQPVKMLHTGIAKNFHDKREIALAQNGVHVAATATNVNEDETIPTLAEVTAKLFLENSVLHSEVFGTYSLLVKCNHMDEMLQVAYAMEGQLTTTLLATESEVKQYVRLHDALKDICGRFILNGVPTGVEVALSMQHGGPYPATTDSRFTAVGADGIKRFARPLCYQGWTNNLLPDELKNENSLHLWRTVNDVLTKNPILDVENT